MQEFLTIRGYADWTPVTQVVEGGETPLFKQYFPQWTEKDAQTGLGRVHNMEKVASEWLALFSLWPGLRAAHNGLYRYIFDFLDGWTDRQTDADRRMDGRSDRAGQGPQYGEGRQ